MSKEFILFEKDHLSFKTRFYLLMDLLLPHQASSYSESLLFLGVFYVQIISGFCSKEIGVFNADTSTSDQILTYFYKILRVKELLQDYSTYKVVIIFLTALVLLGIVYFIIICSKITKSSFYTYTEAILNYYLKIYLFIAFNIILDLAFSSVCFGDVDHNFTDKNCSFKDHIAIFLIAVILWLLTICFIFFIQFFYSDAFFLSVSLYSKISCNYEFYMNWNCVFYSLFLNQARHLSKEVFLLYNLILSMVLLHFYIKHYFYYDRILNIWSGWFHVLYPWTSVFCLIFLYIDIKEKGIIYLMSSAIVLYFYFNWRLKIEEHILLNTPFFKITNKFYLLYYMKNLIDKINSMDENPEDKAILTGIMQMHTIECPNPKCVSKTKNKIYLPLTNEWSDRTKYIINDKVFLMNFVIVIMNFFIAQSYYSPDMLINISLYNWEIIGNFCQALFYYKKVKEMKWNIQEHFSFVRLKIAISKALVTKLKPPNEPCFFLEDLNMSMYFKYDDLSQHFLDEIHSDVNLSLEFWRNFKYSQTKQNHFIDFNKIFHLTDKISITKAKVEVLWKRLFEIFNGVNDWFELYLEYVEQINDDDLWKRDLEAIKRKTENYADHIQQNFYSSWFSKDTGIIIANGDKGKEGIIEKSNKEIENIFKYKPEELRGMNWSSLMPRLFAVNHKEFMAKYFQIGEKRAIDNKDLKSFGKDKDNSIILLRWAIKLFPMWNENVYFAGMIIKENIDDIIFIDNKFNIQGMSWKLMKILQIENKLLFQDNDIPFYVICKKFVNFYKIFLQGKKQNTKENEKKSSSLLLDESGSLHNFQIDQWDWELKEKEEEIENENKFQDNIEINENIELEYEIKLPQFLINYAISMGKRDQNNKKPIYFGNNPTDGGVINENDHLEEEGETDWWVDENNMLKNENTNQDEGTPMPENTFNGINNSNMNQINNNQFDSGKPWDEEKEFNATIDKYKELFTNGSFNELEEYIDQCNLDSTSSDFKFNFTFDRYIYGDKQISYVVRCIDNKNDAGKSDNESIVEGGMDTKMWDYRKEKTEAIKPLLEWYHEEKNDMLRHLSDFIPWSWENKQFQIWLLQGKEDINRMSMIHGQKKEEVWDDENSSQSSTAGYNDNLCKKNRIEEIRSNLMKNVSTFYTWKYIKILAWITSILTIIFSLLFIVTMHEIYIDLKSVSGLNIELYQTAIWINNIVASVMSLSFLLLGKILATDENPLLFLTYIENHNDYFNLIKDKSIDWFWKIDDSWGGLEENIGNFMDNSVELFWGNQAVAYQTTSIQDYESFPLAFSQILTNINSLLQSPLFVLEPLGTFWPNDISYFNYLNYEIIQNSILNLIPSQYKKWKTFPNIFVKHNEDRMNVIIWWVVIYTCSMLLLFSLYEIIIYITNKNMGEGWEKVAKIKLDKIEETMKRIEIFKTEWLKFTDKDNIRSGDGNLQATNDIPDKYQKGKTTSWDMKTTPHPNQFYGSNLNNGSHMGFSNDNKKHKQLRILTYTYFQSLLAFVLWGSFVGPWTMVTISMISSANQWIKVESFLFGKLLISSTNNVKVKCMITSCTDLVQWDFEDIVDPSDIQNIVQGISIYKDLDDFYNNKFWLNACSAAFEESSDEHKNCLEDTLIQSANNTDSLLKLIDDTIESIYKDKEMKLSKDENFKSSELFNTASFAEWENIFYTYITPVNSRLEEIINESLSNYLKVKRMIVIILSIVYGIWILVFCLYISIFFVNKWIHLLSVSRCILRIIPTTVINSTTDLESWIESKY